MYGSDMFITPRSTDYRQVTDNLHGTWLNDWIYLATGSIIVVNDLEGREVAGLQLPASVIDKIYYLNAVNFFCSSHTRPSGTGMEAQDRIPQVFTVHMGIYLGCDD